MKKIETIGIIGFGFVGAAVNALACIKPTNIYDINNKQYNSQQYKRDAYNSDIVFISVPTDLVNNRIDTSIVITCIKDYIDVRERQDNIIVIKSTLPVGVCNNIKNEFDLNNIVFNPEFLSQRTALEDFITQQEVYLAGPREHTFKLMELYIDFFNHHRTYNTVFVETEHYEQIELLKLTRNAYYALKVSFCNNIYNLCEKNGIIYESLRKYFSNGEWVESQHTHVPGPDGKLGYGGKCLPKDTVELLNFAQQSGVEFSLLEEAVKFNEKQRIQRSVNE